MKRKLLILFAALVLFVVPWKQRTGSHWAYSPIFYVPLYQAVVDVPRYVVQVFGAGVLAGVVYLVRRRNVL